MTSKRELVLRLSEESTLTECQLVSGIILPAKRSGCLVLGIRPLLRKIWLVIKLFWQKSSQTLSN